MQATSSQFKTVIAGNEIATAVTVSITSPVLRHNLCPNPNGEFSSGYGWVCPAGVSIVPNSPGTSGIFNFAASSTPPTPYINIATNAGSTYTAQAGIAGGVGGTMAGGVALVAVGIGSSSVVAADGASHLAAVTFTATGSVTQIGLTPQGATSAGVLGVVASLIVEESATALGYFDGDSAGGSWDGTPGQSTSSLAVGNLMPDLSLAVESVDVDRSLVTDMPDGTRLLTGYPSASATIVLSGLADRANAAHDAVWLFNPYNTASPLYGVDVTGSAVVIKAGVANGSGGAAELVPIFTGAIDGIDSLDPQAGTVTLSCLDGRNRLRAAPALPNAAAGVNVPNVTDTGLTSLAPKSLTGAWVVDYLLRASKIYSSPDVRAGAGMYASMCGGAWPQVYDRGNQSPVIVQTSGAWLDAPQDASTPMQFVPGHWNAQVPRDCYLAAGLTAGHGGGNLSGTVDIFAGFGCEWWMNCTLPDPSLLVGGTYAAWQCALYTADLVTSTSFVLTPVSGTTWTLTPAGGGSPVNVTITAGWHKFNYSRNNVNVTLYMDGTLIGSATNGTSPSGSATLCQLVMPYPTECVQVTNENGGLPRTDITPGAYLDASLNLLTATADVTGTDAWGVIQSLAEAEGAVAGFDEGGTFRFINRITQRTSSSVRSITASASLKSMQFQAGASLVATHVTGQVNTLAVAPYGTAWATTDTITIAPRSSYDTTVTGPGVAMVGVGPGSGQLVAGALPSGAPSAAHPVSGYRAVQLSGAEVSNLTMNVKPISPNTASVHVYNPNGFSVVLVTPAGAGYPAGDVGNPCLVVGASVLTASPTVADAQWPTLGEGGAVANARGDITLDLPANDWSQDQGSAQEFVADTLADLYKVRPLWRNVAIVADPSLQLADRVTVIGADGTGLSDDGVIFGLHTTISATDWTQTADLRALGSPNGWLLGVTGRSELSTTTLL